jgi:Na+-transporting NADH:ubiquinone oxidoreductase subunit NqrB
MALALNVFQTITAVVSLSDDEVYTAPTGYTGVVLLCQVANIGSTTESVDLIHRRSSTDTELLKNFPISGNDTANLLSGKLVLESGDKLVLSGSDGSNLKFVASILESLN